MKEPIPGSEGTFKPSPSKENTPRALRRLLKSFKKVKLREFLKDNTLPSKHGSGKAQDPYKKKYKARRKMRRKMAYASKRINRKRR